MTSDGDWILEVFTLEDIPKSPQLQKLLKDKPHLQKVIGGEPDAEYSYQEILDWMKDNER